VTVMDSVWNVDSGIMVITINLSFYSIIYFNSLEFNFFVNLISVYNRLIYLLRRQRWPILLFIYDHWSAIFFVVVSYLCFLINLLRTLCSQINSVIRPRISINKCNWTRVSHQSPDYEGSPSTVRLL